MKLTKCEQGHFYDGDKYPACPYCNTDLQSESAIVHISAAAEAAVEIIRNINEILRLFEQSVNPFFFNAGHF